MRATSAVAGWFGSSFMRARSALPRITATAPLNSFATVQGVLAMLR